MCQKIFIIVLSILLALSGNAQAAQRTQKKRVHAITAHSAILMDAATGKALYSRNVYKKVAPASTAKVMTALLVLENLSLDQVITVGSGAAGVSPSILGVKAGERLRVADLLAAALIISSNDAAVVLAEAVAGSHWQFVKLMNKRAKELGAKHTKFVNAHGLPTKESQFTTAYDMALIFRQAMKHPFFTSAVKTKNKTIQSQAGRRFDLKNHNKLLWMSYGKDIYGKTGYTRKAGPCFVGFVERGKKTFIVSVFGSKYRWDDIQHIVRKYTGR